MPSKLQRLFVKSKLAASVEIELNQAQANYLGNVLRLRESDELLLFNGSDGEWRASLGPIGKKRVHAAVRHQTRLQERGPDLHYLFAPLKRARLDYMVQKATEMGARVLRPVLTRRTVAERVKVDRLVANAIEAAEQCGILRVPEVEAPESLDQVLRNWDGGRALIFADEAAPSASPLEALAALKRGTSCRSGRAGRRLRPGRAREPPCKTVRSPHLTWAAQCCGPIPRRSPLLLL